MRCTLPNGVTRAQAAVFSVAAFQVPIHLLAITSSDTLMIPLYSPHTFLQQVVFGVATLLCVRTIFNNILESVGSYRVSFLTGPTLKITSFFSVRKMFRTFKLVPP